MATMLSSYSRTAPATAVANRARLGMRCLRFAAGACFIGHGAFGVITKAAWVPYFAVFGIPEDVAYRLMPVIGTVDILAGVSIVLSPRPIVMLYMTIWGLWTALLRPLAGESFGETIERAGNYGVPLALLLMVATPRSLRGWFQRVDEPGSHSRSPMRALQATTALLLFGHGLLTILDGTGVSATHYLRVGLPAALVPFIGWMEIIGAVAVTTTPTVALLFAIAIWKLATESLFPLTGAPAWELIERAGSIGAPVALALMSGTRPFARITFHRSNP